MNPVHIYFIEIDIDQDQMPTINFTKKNEIKNVLFDGQNEYGVSRMKKKCADWWKIIKIENKKEQKKISEEIQELIKQNKEPNLTFIISHPETNSIEIPFIKKKWNRTTEKETWLFLIQPLKKMKILHFMTMLDIQKISDMNGVKEVSSAK